MSTPPAKAPSRRWWAIGFLVLLLVIGGVLIWRPWHLTPPEKMKRSAAYTEGFATGLSSRDFTMPRLTPGALDELAKKKHPANEEDRRKFVEGYREGYDGFK